MKVPTAMIRKVAVQKRKAQVAVGGKKKPRPQTPPPAPSQDANEGEGPSSPQPAGPPSAPQAPSAVDLTTDTPPEPRAISPTPNAEPTAAIAEAEPLPMESAPAGGDAAKAEASAPSDPWERGAGASHPLVSLAYNGRNVKRLMTRVCLSELQAEFQELEAPTIYQDTFAAHLWVVNSLAALRDNTLRSHHVHQTVLASVTRAEEAKGALESARREAEATKRALEAARGETEEARQWEAAGLARACAVEAELAACRLQLEMAKEGARESEGRAADAEEVARRADAQAADAATRADEAILRAQEAKERATAAEDVESFKGSTAFAEEVAEGSTKAYLQGFHDGKKKAARVLVIADLRDLESEDGDEQEDAPVGGSASAKD